MALQSYTLALGNLTDDGNGKNYASSKAVYVKSLSDTLAQIYSDSDGLNQITQDGIANATDSNGIFAFWVEAGDYYVEVESNRYRISITGADYFNSRIDETVNQIIEDVAGRGAYYPVGSFEAGFTYTDINQVGTLGTQPNQKYYAYNGGISNLPHVVPAGTDPTLSGNYDQVIYTDHDTLTNRSKANSHPASAIQLNSTETVQEETDRAQKSSKIQKPVQKYSTEELMSLVQTNGDPSVVIKSGASLGFAELIAPITSYANTEVFFEFDYIFGQLGVDFTFNGTAMDDLNRTNSSTINGITAQRVSANTYKVSTTTTATEKAYAAWSIRAVASQACEFKLKSISVVESGELKAVTDFSILAKREDWVSSTSQHSSATTRQRVSIPDDQGATVDCDFCHVSNSGSSEFGKPPYDINYYLDNLATQTNTTKNAKMEAGKYYPYRKQYYIRPSKDVNLIAVGGKAELMCGTEIPTSSWTTHQAGPTVFVRKAPYNPDRNHDANVRNNTAQPQISAFVPDDGRAKSALNYSFTPASSVAEVEAAAGKSYFDGTDLYFSFPSSAGNEDSCFLYVCEVDRGISFPDPNNPTNLTAFNVHVVGCKDYNWRFRPNTLGSKFISLHWCGAYASATNEGYSIDRINSELIHCSAHSNRFDDFNFHDGGTSLLIAPYTRSSGDDGISHHETCVGWVEDAIIKYPAAAFSIPAFGAKVTHKNCIGYAATSGTTSGKQYEGAWGVLSGIGQDSVSRPSYGEFNGCVSYDSQNADYYVVSQNSELASADINRAVTDDGSLSVTVSGASTSYTVKN